MILLVADAGLGTINAVRLTADALTVGGLAGKDLIVVLNRFDGGDDLHQRNRNWLHTQDELTVVALPGEERELAAMVRGTPAAPEIQARVVRKCSPCCADPRPFEIP